MEIKLILLTDKSWVYSRKSIGHEFQWVYAGSLSKFGYISFRLIQ